MSNASKNIIVLLTTIIFIVIVDRILLLILGLPLWEWDETLHYKHRANATKSWNNHKKIIINEYGFHDHSFPKKKKKKEIRILNLGDSITMGHGVTRDETYSAYMETFLKDSLVSYQTVEAINAGVQGYSTFQELELLERSMEFEPDIVTIGFCLNDVTEPFAVNKKFGGVGLDYHKVTQTPNKYLSFLLNETGFGRLIQEIRIKTTDANQEKLNEVFDVKIMLQNEHDGRYRDQWNFVLNELIKIYSFCKSKNLPVILLIFPFTFQFNNPDLAWAQEKLIEHAISNQILYIDFLKIFEETIGTNSEKVNFYFLDQDHFTPEGHKLVAVYLSKQIASMVSHGNFHQ
jgi:lysophospholipase L1-like esterase